MDIKIFSSKFMYCEKRYADLCSGNRISVRKITSSSLQCVADYRVVVLEGRNSVSLSGNTVRSKKAPQCQNSRLLGYFPPSYREPEILWGAPLSINVYDIRTENHLTNQGPLVSGLEL